MNDLAATVYVPSPGSIALCSTGQPSPSVPSFAKTFDTADERTAWTNGNDGTLGLVLPDGIVTGTPNWAAHVQRDTSRAVGSDFPIESKRLAFARGQRYSVCASVKSVFFASAPRTGGLMRVVSGGREISRTSFTLPANWTDVCTAAAFTVPSDDTTLQFGFDADAPPYRVDNVRLVRSDLIIFGPPPGLFGLK